MYCLYKQGRNPDEFSKMIAHVAAWNEQLTSPGKAVTVSIEVEKKRHDLLPLVPLADVVHLQQLLLISLQCFKFTYPCTPKANSHHNSLIANLTIIFPLTTLRSYIDI